MVTFTFDVESIGLHGEGFAVGWCVHQNGIEGHSGVFACSPIAARGTDANREWVHANIPEIAPNLHSPEMVRTAFWTALQEVKNGANDDDEPMIVLADCGWPVEARFLSACVDDRPDEREWQGPYPLHDLATYLLAVGCDPTGHYERRPEEMPVHDPLADARQTARVFWELRRGILPTTTK
jgi:hypothetical protein